MAEPVANMKGSFIHSFIYHLYILSFLELFCKPLLGKLSVHVVDVHHYISGKR